MTTEAVAERPAASRRVRTLARPEAFRRPHPRDHDFFLLMIALVWVGIVMGFGSDMLRRSRAHAPAFPAIVYVHAAVFVTWLCVFTAQILLVRVKRTDVHRRLGKAAVYLFVAVAVIGPLTALMYNRFLLGTPRSNPSFIAIQIADMVSFTVLGTAALMLRRTPQAHKRLMLLALVFIADAGFARWWSAGLADFLAPGLPPRAYGVWVAYVVLYLDGPLLVGLMAAYDWITRRRLHPVFVLGAGFGLGLQLLATWLYVSPWWKPVATALVRF